VVSQPHGQNQFVGLVLCRDELCECGKAFKGPHLKKDLENHRATECPVAIVFCENMCGAKMERRNRAAHVSTECTKRMTHCPLRCGADDLYLDHVRTGTALPFSFCSRSFDCIWEVIRGCCDFLRLTCI
jgi:hypothetical protein